MKLKIIWTIAVSALLLVMIVGFDDSWALKSQGISQTRTMLDSICGIDFCNTSQDYDEKISAYLKGIRTSSISLSDYDDLDKNIAYITKTSNISKDFQLIHFSDGNWQLVNRSFSEGLKQSISDSGESQMEFGGTIDLSSGLENKKTVGSLVINESSVIRPFSDKLKEVKISGNVGKKALPNVLLTIAFPDDTTQDFIMPVDNAGNFEVELSIDKNTQLGEFTVSAKYASALLGHVSFDVAEITSAMPGGKEKINSIDLSSNRVKIPSSLAQSFIIQVTGMVVEHQKGKLVTLELETENGVFLTREVPASRDGEFSTFVRITPDFPEGTHSVVLRYLGEEIARTPITGVSGSLTLR